MLSGQVEAAFGFLFQVIWQAKIKLKKIDARIATVLNPIASNGVVLHVRRQHAVGQGGFHTGELVAPLDPAVIVTSSIGVQVVARSKFRYVYDCGSRQLKRCKVLAQRYTKSLDDKRIDLLFLSHFDDDHVNGVPELLSASSGARAETIVMPWVDNVERLIAFGKASLRGKAISPFFRSLIVDPGTALATFRPGRVVFIRRGPRDPDGGRLIDLNPEDGPDGSFRAKIRPADEGKGVWYPAQSTLSADGSTDIFVVDDGTVVDVSATAMPFSWLFKPYVRVSDAARVSAFERDAEMRLCWSWGAFRHWVEDADVRRDLVSDPLKIRALADAYRSAFGDRNLTSLSLFSGPDTDSNRGGRLLLSLGSSGCQLVRKIGWLGTGDAPLKNHKDANELLSHYLPQQASISTLGLPHHGSVHNYSAAVVATFQPETCVASAKPPRNWKHPHPAVMADVTSQGAVAVHVDDTDGSAFDEAFAAIL